MADHDKDKAADKPEADDAAEKPTVYGTATYHAPKGESKVVEWGGMTFLDGKPTEVTDAAILAVAQGNKLFKCDPEKGTRQDQQHGQPAQQSHPSQPQPQHTPRR